MKVTIIGSGVAGTACALGFRRTGAEVGVYEAHADPGGQVGSFVSLAVNGLRGLAAIGCLIPVQAAGVDVARQRMWSSSGKLLGDVPRGRLSSDELHSVTIMRARLIDILRAEAVRAGATIVTGQRLTGATSSPDGESVRANFDNGKTVDADLVVGADGIWSTTRRILDATAPAPRYAGLWSMSGISRGVDVAADLAPDTFNLVFARNGAFLYLAGNDGSVWWSAQVADPTPPDLGAVDLDTLGRMFAGERVPAAILRSSPRTHRPTLHHVLADVHVWHRDHIVLIGDAAHPVGAGQGASMAIEDAVALTRALGRADSVPAGLIGYGDLRRERVAKMLKMARSNRDSKTRGPLARRIQDVVMPIVLAHVYERATGWLYSEDADALEPSLLEQP